MPPPVEDENLQPHRSLETFVQEPVSHPENYPFPQTGLQGEDHTIFAYNDGNLSVEEKKELLVVTRNSLDIFSSILNTEAEPKPLKVIYLLYTLWQHLLTFKFSPVW